MQEMRGMVKLRHQRNCYERDTSQQRMIKSLPPDSLLLARSLQRPNPSCAGK